MAGDEEDKSFILKLLLKLKYMAKECRNHR